MSKERREGQTKTCKLIFVLNKEIKSGSENTPQSISW
jgi:hypothetical protein